MKHHHLEVGDPGIALASVPVAVLGGGRGQQINARYTPCVPVGPVKAICLHMQVHGIDAHVGITLEDQLVAPVSHKGVQAADFIVIPEVKHVSLSWKHLKEESSWEEGQEE